MTLEELKSKDLIVYECLSGSRAYGLETKDSDVDIKGVFILPRDLYYGLEYIGQVSNESNDIVYYELKRFVELLSKSNPGALEMLYSPKHAVRYVHPLFESLRSVDLLSKQCMHTFGGYAMTQVRKAKGLNKKILNPVDQERKGILDFCYVVRKNGTIKLSEFLRLENMEQAKCGLSKLPHMPNMFALYYGDVGFKGIATAENSNDVSLSSIPKEQEMIGIMSFNKSEYSRYCKTYKEYWDWTKKRNDSRYENTLKHGKNYDAKNMMHTFRLLKMCAEIGELGKLNVHRQDRDYLLSIKRGEFEYNDLLLKAEELVDGIKVIYEHSELPEFSDVMEITDLLIEIRKKFYRLNEKSNQDV